MVHTTKKCPCKGRITLLAPYRGGGGGGPDPLIGPSPYPMLYDPFRVFTSYILHHTSFPLRGLSDLSLIKYLGDIFTFQKPLNFE